MPTEASVSHEGERNLVATPAAVTIRAAVSISNTVSLSNNEGESTSLVPPSRSLANISGSTGVPFADFVGRCFMRGCLWVDMGTAWITAHQPPDKLESEVAGKHDWHVSGRLRTALGIGSCTLASAALVAMFWESSLRSLVPFVFLAVIAYIALRFGTIAGLVGTISSALVFASILFEPRPSLAISNPVDRNHLIVMIVIGICASELLGRRKTQTEYKPWY
jgi:hypothetical protein